MTRSVVEDFVCGGVVVDDDVEPAVAVVDVAAAAGGCVDD
jgi:hypothetical protein